MNNTRHDPMMAPHDTRHVLIRRLDELRAQLEAGMKTGDAELRAHLLELHELHGLLGAHLRALERRRRSLARGRR